MQGGLLHRFPCHFDGFNPPPSRGIWWPRAVLHQASLTFGEPLGQADIQSDIPPVEASGGHKQYYIRSLWHSEASNWECNGQSDIPPVEASGGQEQYYIRSAWHLHSCIRSVWHFVDYNWLSSWVCAVYNIPS